MKTGVVIVKLLPNELVLPLGTIFYGMVIINSREILKIFTFYVSFSFKSIGMK